MNKLFLTCWLSLLAAGLSAQSYNDTNAINIATINQFQPTGKYELYVDSIGNLPLEKILDNQWFLRNNFNPIIYIPNTWITSTIYLKFTLENPLDSSKRIYFLSGTYIKRLLIFKLLANNKLSQLINESHSDGYQPIQLSGGEKAVFIAKINFSKRANNMLTPTFISEDYLEKFKIFRHYKGGSAVFAYIICGVLLMMMFYTGSNHLVSKKNNPFLYVFLYSGAMFFMLFLDALLKSQSGDLSSFYNEYLAFALQLIGIIFYIDFTREFLETKVEHPLINTILQYGKYTLIALLIYFTFIVYFTNNFKLQDAIENGTKIFLLLLGALYIAFAIIKKNILMNYIAIGNFILIFFSAISFFIHIDFINNKGIFVNSMVYYELGITGELILFVAGVVYKKKHALIMNIKKQEDLKNELKIRIMKCV